MALVIFPTHAYYDWAAQFLQDEAAELVGATLLADDRAVSVAHPVVAQLLQRVADGRPAMLPFLGRTTLAWIVAGGTRRELDHTLSQISRFVVPTYAEFATPSGFPQHTAFKSDGDGIHQLGAQLYPAGYYALRSPTSHLETMLSRLGHWIALESLRPALHTEHARTYQQLYEDFIEALAASCWTEAEHCLQEIQQRSLSTADNLAFMQIQLLAQQQRWNVIWQRVDFPTIASLRMPRAVRAAMLTAFHHHELLALEQQERWDAALDVVRLHRPRLGLLLTARFALTDPPVVHVFAYQAALMSDQAELAELERVATETTTKQLLSFLRSLQPDVPEPPGAALSPLQLARVALAEQNYDAAIGAAAEVAQLEDRALLLLEVAFASADVQAAEHALLTFWELPKTRQDELAAGNHRLRLYVQFLDSLVSTGVSRPEQPAPIQTWLEWFASASKKQDNPLLRPALDYLAAVTDDRYWTLARVESLSNALLAFVMDARLMAQPYARRAITQLVSYFLKDQHFPREEDEYGDLYETLYMSYLTKAEKNMASSLTLLRLADALLRRKPDRGQQLGLELQDWFSPPVPVLEEAVLEALDLLAEFGVHGSALAQWYREWVTHLLHLPTARQRTSIETWLAFGEWIQPGSDLLAQLWQALAAAADEDGDNPVAQLPPGYRIGIFTLRRSSAYRAKEALLARNPDLDVRVCMEEDLSDQAKAIARNSDLAVVVTTCITHALTYGITPYLQSDPIYPQSSGSTSIIRAIESALRVARHQVV